MQQKTFIEDTYVFGQSNAIKANDDAALKSLYENNYYKTEKYVLMNNGSIEQAKDIYQEAFIAVWRNIQLDKFNPENESAVAGYLYQIARNKWVDHLRSNQYKKSTPLSNLANRLPEETAEEEDNGYIDDVVKQFKQLGENCREVLTLFYYKKESMKTIAKLFDWTEATARNNKYRCLQRLRELLKKQSNHWTEI
jgi:RNA polymerase sigma factor (sigma-70 family)